MVDEIIPINKYNVFVQGGFSAKALTEDEVLYAATNSSGVLKFDDGTTIKERDVIIVIDITDITLKVYEEIKGVVNMNLMNTIMPSKFDKQKGTHHKYKITDAPIHKFVDYVISSLIMQDKKYVICWKN